MPSSAGDGVSAVSAQPKERSRNAVARAAAFRLLGAGKRDSLYIQISGNIALMLPTQSSSISKILSRTSIFSVVKGVVNVEPP